MARHLGKYLKCHSLKLIKNALAPNGGGAILLALKMAPRGATLALLAPIGDILHFPGLKKWRRHFFANWRQLLAPFGAIGAKNGAKWRHLAPIDKCENDFFTIAETIFFDKCENDF